MSNPINAPASLLAAQAATYMEGQKTQSKHSDSKAERDRRYNQLLAQAKAYQQEQEQTAGTQKGFLA